MNSVDWHKQARYVLHITRCKLIALISKDDWDLGGNNGAGRSDSLCIAGNPGYTSPRQRMFQVSAGYEKYFPQSRSAPACPCPAAGVRMNNFSFQPETEAF
jgi:hypothetical protein